MTAGLEAAWAAQDTERRAYRAASAEERCQMIRDAYAAREAAQMAERRAAWDQAHGEGSFDRRRAAIMAAAARPITAESMGRPALTRPRDRLGYWEHGR
jgi:hypothetical protein